MTTDRIIAISGIGIAILTFFFSLHQYIDSNKEKIIAFSDGNNRTLKNAGIRVNKNGALLSLTNSLKLTISNNSKRPISIVDYKISNLYNGKKVIFDNQHDSLNIIWHKQWEQTFPINLNSFESKNIFIHYEMYLNRNVSNIFLDAFDLDIESDSFGYWCLGYSWDSVLQQKGIDILGNYVEDYYTGVDNKNSQEIRIELISSNKNQFISTISL